MDDASGTVLINASPSAQRVAKALEERIERGHYPPAAWLPTERSLASEFHVDRSAVRAALAALAERGLIVRLPGRRPWVSDQIQPKQTRVTRRPRAVALQTIAAIVPQHPFYPASAAILRGINQTLRRQEALYRLVVFDTHGAAASIHADLERHALEVMEREDIAGAILWHMGGDQTLPLLGRLHDQGVPLVFVDRYPAGLMCDFVGVDNRAVARDAVDYLLDLGHTRVAHLTNTDPVSTVPERIEGYRDALSMRGLPPSPELIHAVPSGLMPNVGLAVEHFLGLPEPPTALFAMNDSLAHFFITEAEARGRRVPDDISVIGIDDLERFSPRPALLTTMHQPFDQIGQRAADLLLRRLAADRPGALAYQHVLLPAPLVVRSTCREYSS